MTHRPNAENALPGHDPDRQELPANVRRPMVLTRAVLAWEEIVSCFGPACVWVLLFVSLAWLGFFEALPAWAHWLCVSGFIAGLAFLLFWFARDFAWPTRAQALKRLEADSGLTHAPFSTLSDTAAAGTGNPALWQAHLTAARKSIDRLSVKAPRPVADNWDPLALRYATGLLVVIALVASPGAHWQRLADALIPSVGESAPIRVEAWATPPDYMGLPPLYLTQEAGNTAEETDSFSVPVGSVFSIRVHGLKGQARLFYNREQKSLDRKAPQEFALQMPIQSSGTLELVAQGRVLRNWQVNVSQDLPPQVAFNGEATKALSGTMEVPYTLTDDYGLKSASLRFELMSEPDDENSPSISYSRAPHPTPAVDAPTQALPVSPGQKESSRTVFVDLTSHPWAGLPARMILSAEDAAGNTSTVSQEIVLPQRQFEDPTARAIIEQRRRLAMNPRQLSAVASALDALTYEPERYFENQRAYLSLRAAYWRMVDARYPSDLTGIFDLLWSVALSLEDGDLSLAAERLQDAQEKLTQALQNGAGPEEIDRLMNELRNALNTYLNKLAEQGGVSEMPQNLSMPQSGGQTLTDDDLQRMLEEIDRLAKSGATDQAEQMLTQLRNMLENIETNPGEASLSPEQEAMSGALDAMNQLMQDQQQLMDETFQHAPAEEPEDESPDREATDWRDFMRSLEQARQEAAEEKDGQTGSAPAAGPSEGGVQGGGTSSPNAEGSKPGPNAQALQSLAQAQQALQKRLQALQNSLSQKGVDAPGRMGDADTAMGAASQDLSASQARPAMEQQGKAMEALRQAAQGMADQLIESMSAGQGMSQGMGSVGRSRTDPLGRNTGNGGSASGALDLPEEFDAQRAREILEELRRRAGEMNRPAFERDYIDRLLERF